MSYEIVIRREERERLYSRRMSFLRAGPVLHALAGPAMLLSEPRYSHAAQGAPIP
jgi:hypothetical protein